MSLLPRPQPGPQGPAGPSWSPDYGQFSSSQTQIVSGANVPTIITHNTTELSNGIIYDPAFPSRIVVSKVGVYKFSYSVQLDKSGGGVSNVEIFIRVNQNNIPNSSSRTTVEGQNGENFVMCEYLLSLNANDYVETVFVSADNTMAVTAFPAVSPPNAVPAVPSIITTIYQIA